MSCLKAGLKAAKLYKTLIIQMRKQIRSCLNTKTRSFSFEPSKKASSAGKDHTPIYQSTNQNISNAYNPISNLQNYLHSILDVDSRQHLQRSQHSYQPIQMTAQQFFQFQFQEIYQPLEGRQGPVKIPHVDDEICRQRIVITQQIADQASTGTWSSQRRAYQKYENVLVKTGQVSHSMINQVKKAIQLDVTHDEQGISQEQIQYHIPPFVQQQIQKLRRIQIQKASSNSTKLNKDYILSFILSESKAFKLQQMIENDQKLKELSHDYKGKWLPLLRDSQIQLERLLQQRYYLLMYQKSLQAIEEIEFDIKYALYHDLGELSPAISNAMIKILSLLQRIQ